MLQLTSPEAYAQALSGNYWDRSLKEHVPNASFTELHNLSVPLMPIPQHPLQQQPSIRFTETEDGEVIGTVRQLSGHFNLPKSRVVPCLHECGTAPIILRAGSGPGEVLILDSGGADTLRQCGAVASIVG